MNKQLEISFLSPSPINTLKLTGQNERLYNFLMEGGSIHLFSPAKKMLKIGFINSRISDLKKLGAKIEKKMIEVEDSEGEKVMVKLYWIAKENRINNKIAA